MLTWNICKIKQEELLHSTEFERSLVASSTPAHFFVLQVTPLKPIIYFGQKKAKEGGPKTPYRVLPLPHGRLLETF
jgi:hypothetical protein